MTALVLGTILALGALAYVLWPVIVSDGTLIAPRLPASTPSATSDEHGEAVAALREIEFDHATGKLSEADYASLKTQYTSEAVAAMRGRQSITDDVVEAAISRARAVRRVCPVCGPRPEPAARYCSRCGVALV